MHDHFLDFIKQEAKRRNMHQAEVIREIQAMGQVRYKIKYKLEK